MREVKGHPMGLPSIGSRTRGRKMLGEFQELTARTDHMEPGM